MKIDVRCPACTTTTSVKVVDYGFHLVCQPCGAGLDDALDAALDAVVREAVERLAGDETPDPYEIPKLARAVTDAVGVPCVVAYSPFMIETMHEPRIAPRYVLVAYAVPAVKITRWQHQYNKVFGGES